MVDEGVEKVKENLRKTNEIQTLYGETNKETEELHLGLDEEKLDA